MTEKLHNLKLSIIWEHITMLVSKQGDKLKLTDFQIDVLYFHITDIIVNLLLDICKNSKLYSGVLTNEIIKVYNPKTNKFEKNDDMFFSIAHCTAFKNETNNFIEKYDLLNKVLNCSEYNDIDKLFNDLFVNVLVHNCKFIEKINKFIVPSKSTKNFLILNEQKNKLSNENSKTYLII